jgi:alcohol dehydrogenase class IV
MSNYKPPISTYIWPGQTHFGFGTADLAGQEVKALGARRVFVVGDPGIIAAGLLQPVEASLKVAGLSYRVYDEVKPNPDVASVEAAAAVFRESEADLIVGVGGGSALDTAKAVRLLADGQAGIMAYDLLLGPEMSPASRQMPPMMAIPTTAGTGSEVTCWAVITDLERKLKFAVGGPFLIPTIALIDPGLMLSLPPFLTAATGMDALSHCIESYVSTIENPAIDPTTLYGIELIGRNLRVATTQGSNQAARSEMALAAMIGGMVLNCKWGGACHSLAHQLSTFAEVHHGAANALMLPPQMAYSLIGAVEKYARIGEALGIPPEGSLRQRAEGAVEAVRQLILDLGLPMRLRDVGITEAMIPEMAKNAYIDNSWLTNPRAVSEAVMAELFRQAW